MDLIKGRVGWKNFFRDFEKLLTTENRTDIFELSVDQSQEIQRSTGKDKKMRNFFFTPTELLTFSLGIMSAMDIQPTCKTYTGCLYFVDLPESNGLQAEIYTTIEGVIKFYAITDGYITLSTYRVAKDACKHLKTEAIFEATFKAEASELMGFRV